MPNTVFHRDGDVINVWGGYRGLTSRFYGNQYNGTTFKKVLNDLGNAEWASKDLDTAKPMLMINQYAGSTTPYTGGSADDVIINIQDNASIHGEGGNDTIVNFCKTVGTLDGGDGNDAIYSVGLTSGTIKAVSGTEDGYIKIVNNMAGGTIELGSGRSVLDAAGRTLNNVDIIEGAGARSTALIAKKVIGKNLSFAAEQVAIDLQTVDVNITLGTGANSFVANTVKDAVITSGGVDSFQFKTLNNATIRAAGSSVINITNKAKDSTFDLSTGANTINAARRVLTSVSISDKAGASTAVIAKAIIGKADAQSTVNLKGSEEGSGVSVSGGVNQASIGTGTGAGTLEAGTIRNTVITMGGLGTFAQSVVLKGDQQHPDRGRRQ